MKTTADYLDAMRVKLDLPSDGRLAAYLGIHRQYISRYRNNVISFDDEMSIKVAEILGLESTYVMACMHYQRAKQPEVKKAWAHAAEMLYGLAATVLLAVLVTANTSGLPTSPEAFNGLHLLAFAGSVQNIHYANISMLAGIFLLLLFFAFPRKTPPPEKEADQP